MSSRARRRLTTLLVAGAVLTADQVTKSLAVADLTPLPRHVIGPFSLVLAYNSGVAFSIGSGHTWPIVAGVVIVIALVVWLTRYTPSVLGSVGAGCVVGGALGNLADRLFRGHGGAVIDFVYTSFWPTFNVADSGITIGALLLLVALWRHGAARDAAPSTPDVDLEA